MPPRHRTRSEREQLELFRALPGDLAPRDIVARAIHRQIETGGGAFLDARKAVGARFPDEFPAVFAACMAGGVDPRAQPIAVRPSVCAPGGPDTVSPPSSGAR